MSHNLVKKGWYERALEIASFHKQCCREDNKWTIQKTAVSLNRSVGSISHDLQIASWSKTHEKQLKRCSSLRDAIAFIQVKKRELNLAD